MVLNSTQTAAKLPYVALAGEIERLLRSDSVQVPERIVQSLPGGASLFVMPAADERIAMTKLISFTPSNAQEIPPLPTIQGDVLVFDVATGQRIAVLDGPTVTARRTAAVSLLAASKLAPCREGSLLIVGAGVQGLAHLEAFSQASALGLNISEVFIYSRTLASSQALADQAHALGLKAQVLSNAAQANAALAHCPFVVTCTSAQEVVIHASPRPDAFVAAVGSFKPSMVELSPTLVQHFAAQGRIVVDTPHAQHEAGDLLQAGIDVSRCESLQDVVRNNAQHSPAIPVLFKSCGWAGWDLAAARLACLAD